MKNKNILSMVFALGTLSPAAHVYAQCFSVSLSHTNVTCNGDSNGTATASVTGGTAPYAYSWSTTPAQTAATATGLTAGTYIVAVNDATPCPVIIDTVTITEPAALIVSVGSTNASSCSASDGSAVVNASGGTAPYTYSWSTTPVQTTIVATGLAVGTYSVTVTDVNFCSLTATVNITCVSSVASLTVQNEFVIFPNPTDGKFQVSGLKLQVANIEIYNLLGEKIYSTAVIGRPASVIDISNHPEGIYFLNIKTVAASFTHKLIIQK